ncbi:hypothetical protein GOODEAATRI_029099, partial [Goodea atripinnis]
MNCDSMEQFILGFGTSRIPAIFAGRCCRYSVGDETTARGKLCVTCVLRHVTPRGRCVYVQCPDSKKSSSDKEVDGGFVVVGETAGEHKQRIPTVNTAQPSTNVIVQPSK